MIVHARMVVVRAGERHLRESLHAHGFDHTCEIYRSLSSDNKCIRRLWTGAGGPQHSSQGTPPLKSFNYPTLNQRSLVVGEIQHCATSGGRDRVNLQAVQ